MPSRPITDQQHKFYMKLRKTHPQNTAARHRTATSPLDLMAPRAAPSIHRRRLVTSDVAHQSPVMSRYTYIRTLRHLHFYPPGRTFLPPQCQCRVSRGAKRHATLDTQRNSALPSQLGGKFRTV